ncbi:hypothetical protein HPB47_016748, partial [Ixodes persulcatus]
MSRPSSSMASSEATASCPTLPLAEPSEGSAILLARPVEIKASRLQTKPAALIGSSEISRLTVVPSSPRRKALFVTKLSPETTAANITEHLASVGVQSVQCSRLKTRFDTSDACSICSRCFYGRQRFLRCSGCQLRAHTKCICWPENETTFLQSGVSSFICKSCEKISGDARPNGDSQAGLDEASLSHHSAPPSPTASNRPEGPASSSPGGTNADMESLRALLLDSLEGISFLTDEVAALRDENAQLRREYRQSSQLQASAIQSLRTELRAVRETRCQMGPAGGRQLPFSYAAVTSPHHPLSSARGGGGTPLLAGEASSSAPVDGLSATLNESRTDLAEPVQPSGHPRRQAPSNFNGAGFRGAGHKFNTARRLQAHIQRRGPVRELVCTRLKTRHEGYSSFHVTAADDEMEKLFDPLLWPEGSLFKEFTGQLTDSRTYQA